MFKLFEVYPLLTLEYEIDGRLGGIIGVGFEELKAMIKLNSTSIRTGIIYLLSGLPNLEFS